MPTVPATRRLSPKVRRLLDEHGVSARSVAGTGRQGRVTPHDVLAAAVLVRRPGLEVAAALPPSDDGRAYPAVHVGFPGAYAPGGEIAVVPDVQYLTVAGLARRARVAITVASWALPVGP